MPRKSDTIAINNPKLDKRVKLTDEDRKNIIFEYEFHKVSQRFLADKYGVSRRTIQFTLDPEKKKRAQEQLRERQKDGRYYDKEKHRESVQKHREYKKELFEKQLIK
ncbi:hypothetical protein [Vagococcus fluvialis]|uniref:hypothetical protein n=1 Tax=Vagococcus fluvialis TaxID=2738 RepID=UPI001D09A7AE|nr:hypothetical protein [Vagococcus fluvialis]UDM72783.1 hypothetical protein K5L00_14610 [Vagococcus fluvialis]UDM78339.1 hypothetical protein K5K98_14815 [Vagococcus fluvialis]UDM84058.1 hypothetical protein K5K96_14635 [Vagococcus fluvialis]